MRDEVDPVLASRRRDRRLRDPEVLGAAGVGEDDQPVAVVRDVVLGHRVALRDQDRRGVGPRRVDEPHLARHVVVGVDHHEPARLGERDVHEEPGVRLFVDEGVVRGVGAHPVAQHLAGAVVVVEQGVEERLVVRRPDESTRAALDGVAELLSGLEVLHPQGEVLGAVLVDAPGEPPVVPGVAPASDAVVALALGLGVAVQQILLAGGVTGRAPAHHRVLSALAVAVVVLPCAVLRRDAGVVLPDAPAEFVEQGDAKRLGRCEHRILVGVLGFQVLADVRSQGCGVAHYLLPVVVLEPGVVIGAPASVQDGKGGRLAGSDGRSR